mgnify:CR=1 FL=1
MAVLYLAACLYIILSNFSFVDDAFALIFREAFNPQAIGVGGIIGVLLVGFKRAAFSNEAGAGSASIASATSHGGMAVGASRAKGPDSLSAASAEGGSDRAGAAQRGIRTAAGETGPGTAITGDRGSRTAAGAAHTSASD